MSSTVYEIPMSDIGDGDTWLADCSMRPDLVREVWALEGLAPIASGTLWLATEVHLTTGMHAHTRIHPDMRGPFLVDPGVDLSWFLVPLSTATELADTRAPLVRPSGWRLPCPPTGRQACGRLWLTRPDGSGQLTDPSLLAAALRPGGHRLPSGEQA
ncbi:hypothetical protein ACFWM5_01355 [Streptomyces bobili]|uniref:hypothetical protein n=1 Tax=Streptomyces bobili TaxID=67280 RepID=UPI003659C0EA